MGTPEKPRFIEPTPVELLSGSERFDGLDATVSDFWRWAFSDLRTNIVRGILAEFLVARAVGASDPVRVAWDNFDVVSPSGIRIEVKSSAYLQSWAQRKLSTINFAGLTGLRWDAEEGWGTERELRADVFVFAIETCRDPAAFNPMNLDQWLFHVVPAEILRRRGTRSVGMGFLRRHAPNPVTYEGLAGAVDACRAGPAE